MEGLAAFLTVNKVVELSGKIAIECWKYYSEIKGARDDIERLRKEVIAFQDAAKMVQTLLEGTQSQKLEIPTSTSRSLEQCGADLANVEKELQPTKMRKFGLRALKWPMSSGEVDKIITMLKRHELSLNTVLNLNQIKLSLKIDSGLEHADQERYLAMIPCAKSATFTSLVHQHDPFCHQDTRVEILQEIEEWSEATDGKHVYWLNGMAGTGKSTIARTVARHFTNKGYPCGNFFFSRGGGELSKADKLANTLAASLAAKSKGFKNQVCEAIKADNDVGHQGIREQWKQLIYEPLMKADKVLRERTYFILIVDALDECESEDDIIVFIELLSMTLDLSKAQLRVFITSRPELHIRLGFQNMAQFIYRDLILDQVDRSVVDHDIRLFLKAEMAKIGSKRKVPVGWPSQDALDLLVERAHSLFIYAATVTRYVGESRRVTPEKRLSGLLAGTTAGMTSERSLDVMYLNILESSLAAEHSEHELVDLSSEFQLVVGTIVLLYEPMSAKSLSGLLNVHLADSVSEDEGIHDLINNTIDPFASLISIPQTLDSPIRVIHPSFRDFLTSENRCTAAHFRIDSTFVHGALCSACLHILDEYDWSFASQAVQPGLLSSELNGVNFRWTLAGHIQYAAKYWLRHCLNCPRKPDAMRITRFFEKNLLKWLLLTIYLGELGNIVEDLRALVQLRGFMPIPVPITLQCAGSSTETATTFEQALSDLISFICCHRATIEYAPNQLYISALLLSPHNSIVRRIYESAIPAWISMTPVVETTWNEAVETFEAHSEEILDLASAPGSRLLASASKDNTARIWNLQNGALETTLTGHNGPVQSVAVSGCARFMATASKDGTARIWNVRTGACEHVLEGHAGTVHKVLLSSKLGVVATGSQDGDIRLWNILTGEMNAVLRGDHGAVTDLAFSVNEACLAAGYYDGAVCLWDPVTHSLIARLCDHESAVNSILFSHGPWGHVIATASYDRTVKIWSVNDGALLATLRGHTRLVKSISCSASGNILASASFDNTVKVWDVASGELIHTLKGHKDALICVAFPASTETMLASAGKDRTVRVWDAIKGEVLCVYKGHSRTVNAMSWTSPRPGQELLASASRDHTIRIWDPSSRKAVNTEVDAHSDEVSGVELSPDGKLLATRSKDKSVRLWHAATGRLLTSFQTHSDWVSAVVFSPDNQMLASGAYDHAICLYHIDGRILRKIDSAHSRSIVNLVFSPDSQKLASCAYDRSVRVWSTQGDLLCDFNIHTRQINIIQFSADSRRLASASYDATVAIYDVEGNAPLRQSRGHIRAVNAVHFSPDGSMIASGAKDCTVKVWDVETGELKMTLRGHDDSVSFVLFSPAGDRLISRAGSQVNVWNAKSGYLLSIQTAIDPFLLDQGSSGMWSTDGAILVKQVATGQLEDQLRYRYSREWLRLSSPDDTDQESIRLTNSSDLEQPPKVSETAEENENSFGIGKNLQWITHAGQNILFLPGHIRPRVFALTGETVITGNGTGEVMVFGFDRSAFRSSQRRAPAPNSWVSATSSVTLT